MTNPAPQLRNGGLDEAWIDEILAESFPASDPPSWTLGREPTPEEPPMPVDRDPLASPDQARGKGG